MVNPDKSMFSKSLINKDFSVLAGKVSTIADVKGKHNLNLENETKILAEKIGFKPKGELKLALSNINMRGKEEKFKYEPIFIFEK